MSLIQRPASLVKRTRGHRRTGALATFTVATVCLAFQSTGSSSSASASFVIQHVRLFDGEQVFLDRTIVVREGLIESIGQGPARDDLPRIDGRGNTLLPGLIDAHTHTDDPEQLRQALVFGVTTCLDMNTPLDRVRPLRDAAATRMDVADFRSAGILATAPGGHGTERGRNIPTVPDANVAESFVAARKAEGSDYLKIALNGVRHARDGMPTLAPATVKALIAAGHSRNLLVVAHIETVEDARLVVESGGDGLAHVWRDRGAAPDLIALIAARHVFVVPTLSVPDSYTAGTGAALAADRRLRPYIRESTLRQLETPPAQLSPGRFQPINQFLDAVRSLAANDAMLVAGTDTGAINMEWRHGIALHRELELYVQAGLTPVQALQAATANAANAFKLTDRGRIAHARRADLLLVRGDPTTDITATRDILRVWKAGVELSRSPQKPTPPHNGQ